MNKKHMSKPPSTNELRNSQSHVSHSPLARTSFWKVLTLCPRDAQQHTGLINKYKNKHGTDNTVSLTPSLSGSAAHRMSRVSPELILNRSGFCLLLSHKSVF